MLSPVRLFRNRSRRFHAGLLTCAGVGVVAELGLWRGDWTTALLGGDTGLRAVAVSAGADVLTVAACSVAGVAVARLAWDLRQRGSLRTAGYGLSGLLALSCAKRIADLVSLAHGRGGFQASEPAPLASLVVSGGVLLLMPLFRELAADGRAARLAEERFVSAAETGPQAFLMLQCEEETPGRAAALRVSFANANAEKLLMTRRRDLLEMPLSRVLTNLVGSGMAERLWEVQRTGLPYSGEIRATGERGQELCFELRAMRTQSGIAVMMRDLAEERARERQVDELHRFSQSLIGDAPFAILATDTHGTITAMNEAAERLTLYRREDMVGRRSLLDLHDPEELRERIADMPGAEEPGGTQMGFSALVASLGQRVTAEDDWHYLCPDGRRIPVHVTLTSLRDRDGVTTGYLVTAHDIAERKKLTDSITYLAQHDGLTGLANRVKLRDRLQQALERARRLNQPVGVVLLGLDNFKRVNDSLGQAAGDELLVLIAERLRATVRGNDTVARVGGDTFAVVMPNCGSEEDARRAAMRLANKVQAPLRLAGRELSVTAGVGMSLFPQWGDDAASLLRNADTAMYSAKRNGHGCLEVFSGALEGTATDELELESELRRSLINEEMELFYQPQVDCRTGELRGVEALLRWRHPQRGLLAAGEFITAAEESGFILQLGHWVLERACEEGRMLQERLGRRITIAVNLSPRQFLQQNLDEMVQGALRRSGLAAADLELEITEYTLMISSAETIAALSRLRALGVKIALDDFGTGFSNFKYILDYKVDRLKIDRSFVSKCPEDANASAIVRTVIAMAHGLAMEVVAEGVETEEQRAFLSRRRCDQAQGYLFSRAVAAEDLLRWYEESPKGGCMALATVPRMVESRAEFVL
ncbi:MAG TPA: EAL domain-containing protein [Acidobacteriaceae bacterium]|nr:EAL domain-containing protein [Acidobacteriaceae bacterium]